jgi:hypothetical protein
VVLLRRRWWAVPVAALAIAVGWGLVLRDGAADCPGGLPTVQGCGTFYDVEVRLFGAAHTYGAGTADARPGGARFDAGAWPPSWPATPRPRCCSTSAPQRGAPDAALLAVAGCGWRLTHCLLELQPVGKRMWTPSFLAVHAAVGIAVLPSRCSSSTASGPRGSG